MDPSNNQMRQAEYQVVICVDNEDGRLHPFCDSIPRCLLTVANRKVLSYQLDCLVQSGVADVIIVASTEYSNALKQFKAEELRDNIHIELVFVEDMSGSADGLRAIADRIRGEFVCMTADNICQVSLSALVNKHRMSTSDFTMLLASIPYDEPVKKGGSKVAVLEEQDIECIGLTNDGRVVMKTLALDIDSANMSLSKAMIKKYSPMSIRYDLIDVGVYVMSKWVLDCIKAKVKYSSIRMDLIPFLVARQNQPREYLLKEVPGLENRKRYLDTLDAWVIGNATSSNSSVDLVTSLSQALLVDEDDEQRDTSPAGNDLLRCFAQVYDNLVGPDGKEPMIIQRIANMKSYINLNRDIPLVNHINACWPKIENFLKKEQSVVGKGYVNGDKVTIQQSTIGTNVQVGAKSKLGGCIVMNNTKIGENVFLQNCIIAGGVTIENNCSLTNCLVGFNYTVAGNTNNKGETFVVEDDM